MKRILSVVLILSILLFLFSGCSEKEIVAEYCIIADKLTETNTINIVDDITNHLSENKIIYNIKNSGGNLSTQRFIINQCIEEGIENIVIIPVSYYGLEDIIAEAKAQDVNVIILEHDVFYEGKDITRIFPDRIDAVKKLTETALEVSHFDNVLEIQGEILRNFSNVSAAFKQCVYDKIDGFHTIENVKGRTDSFNEIQDLIYRKEIDVEVIFSHTQEISMGIIDSFIVTKENKMKLLSLECNEDILKSIAAGYTVVAGYFDRNYGEMIIKIHNGIEFDDKINYYLLHRNNIQSIIERLYDEKIS